ncbi:Xylose isomerase [Glycine soja]|uniref:Xylose isomerase n=1 Tax=Glycine soja TaxID=3848 RepID=A0A0B2PKU4_GLYSO|nr:Xylose isomerase [Glycine soja]
MEVEGSSKKTIVMQQKEIAEARVPLSYRDQCAHLLIPRNRVREVRMCLHLNGADPFGAPTKYWPWEDGTNSLNRAK